MVDTPLEAFEKRIINLEKVLSNEIGERQKMKREIENINAAVEELRA